MYIKGKSIRWDCFRTGWCGEYFDVGRREVQDAGDAMWSLCVRYYERK
jgi:hypothetical protein